LSIIRDLDNGVQIDGARFQDIAFKLRGMASELDVRSCIDALMNDSAIYTTVDEDTFKIS
jgi:hypothetical protein